MSTLTALPSSYRDNDGFVFKQNNKYYRLIKPSYFSHYDLLMNSGLYKALTDAGRLVQHEEINDASFSKTVEGKIILPEQIPFISYAYEWSFDMWRDAAIVTLKIALQALEYGVILKDATPFNIQFFKGRPVFIDTLSFEKYDEGTSWIAYHQFCECFLGPLLLMHYGHRDLGKFFLVYPNGIPLDVIKRVLPFKSKFNMHVYLHIWLQAKMANKSKGEEGLKKEFSKQKLITLLNGLTSFVSGLSQKKMKSVWDDYYTDTILGNQYLEAKKIIVKKFIDTINFKTVIDLGANDGYFSLLLKDKAENIIATDFDSNCINELYTKIRKDKIKNIVPLVSTLNIPTPSIGWNNEERSSLKERLKADLVLALALVHHLAIAVNIPLSFIAKWFSEMSTYLIIEFVPKSDEKVKQLLANREDIFDEYDLESFKKIFAEYYKTIDEVKVGNTERALFLMKIKQ
jgi:ribosomal protein L11 methylase PrmA